MGMQDCSNSTANALGLLQSYTIMAVYGNHEIDGLSQKRCNSIANALELHLSCTNPSKWFGGYHINLPRLIEWHCGTPKCSAGMV